MASMRTIGIYGRAGQETVHRNLSGIVRYCQEHGGYNVLDFRTPVAIARYMADTRHRPPWRGRVDGIILSTGRQETMPDSEVADWMLGGGVPAVSVATDWIDPRIPVVYLNVASLAALAAEHLAACGCRSFMFFGLHGTTGSGQRAAEFKKALAKIGQKMGQCASHHRYGEPSDAAVLEQTKKELHARLQKMEKPVGVWALNDFFAGGVWTACHALGLAVPEQVKILGVDDISFARSHKPPLSSIRTPREQIGYVAMQTLHKMLESRRGVRKRTEVGDMELVPRTSTMGPPQRNESVDAAIEYIARHACERLTVEQVARAMGIGRRALEVRFQSLVGHSPSQEIQRVRLARAKELLLTTDISIGRIASMVGFEEASAFNNFFNKHTSTSPRQFRRKRKGSSRG